MNHLRAPGRFPLHTNTHPHLHVWSCKLPSPKKNEEMSHFPEWRAFLVRTQVQSNIQFIFLIGSSRIPQHHQQYQTCNNLANVAHLHLWQKLDTITWFFSGAHETLLLLLCSTPTSYCSKCKHIFLPFYQTKATNACASIPTGAYVIPSLTP